MRPVEVYKLTQDSWYPEYTCEDGKLVSVSFKKTGPLNSENFLPPPRCGEGCGAVSVVARAR